MKISVCMATYNGEKYIKEQITSILSQLNDGDELIISDDKSSDRTQDIIFEFRDPRIKFVINEGERGYTRNFENAIRHATGDVIFLSDQDDVWMENKVELMLKRLRDCDLVVSDAEIVDANLETLFPSHFELFKVKKGFWVNFCKTRYVGACMAFKKELLKKALPFPKKQKYCAHDYWLTIVGEMYYKVELERTPLIKYRRHGNNASTGGMVSNNSFIKKVLVRAYCFVNLLLRSFK